MNKPHKWAEVIKAWADGAIIEVRSIKAPFPKNAWVITNNPVWVVDDGFEYRVKPVKKSPGLVFYHSAWGFNYSETSWKSFISRKEYEKGAIAVIEAYKRGELDYE